MRTSNKKNNFVCVSVSGCVCLCVCGYVLYYGFKKDWLRVILISYFCSGRQVCGKLGSDGTDSKSNWLPLRNQFKKMFLKNLIYFASLVEFYHFGAKFRLELEFFLLIIYGHYLGGTSLRYRSSVSKSV